MQSSAYSVIQKFPAVNISGRLPKRLLVVAGGKDERGLGLENVVGMLLQCTSVCAVDGCSPPYTLT